MESGSKNEVWSGETAQEKAEAGCGCRCEREPLATTLLPASGSVVRCGLLKFTAPIVTLGW